MPLTITFDQPPSGIEVPDLLPERVRTLSAPQLLTEPVTLGNGTIELGEVATVTGSATEDETLVLAGDCGTVRNIGSGMASGTLRVEGNAGLFVGEKMRGGRLDVTGDVTDWAGMAMRGGVLSIAGNAGNLLGAAERGARRGMTGGVILVKGDAGHEVGHTMRRGTIAIGGRCGDAAGYGMIAGSIVMTHGCGRRPGAFMKRGSLITLDPETPPKPLPTFAEDLTFRPSFLSFYERELARLGFEIDNRFRGLSYRRYLGDRLQLGKGELLMGVSS